MSSSINLQPRAMRPNSEVEKLLNPKNLVHAIAGNNPQGFFEAAKKEGVELRDGHDMFQFIEMMIDGQDGPMLSKILKNVEYKPDRSSAHEARNMVEAIKLLNQKQWDF